MYKEIFLLIFHYEKTNHSLIPLIFYFLFFTFNSPNYPPLPFNHTFTLTKNDAVSSHLTSCYPLSLSLSRSFIKSLNTCQSRDSGTKSLLQWHSREFSEYPWANYNHSLLFSSPASKLLISL